jgi:hypothetical protein
MEEYSDCLPSKKVIIDRFKWQGLQEKQQEQPGTWEPSQGFFEDKRKGRKPASIWPFAGLAVYSILASRPTNTR